MKTRVSNNINISRCSLYALYESVVSEEHEQEVLRQTFFK